MFWTYIIDHISHHGHLVLQVLQLLRFATYSFSHILSMAMVHTIHFFLLTIEFSGYVQHVTEYCTIYFAALWPHAYAVRLAEEGNSRNANSYSVRPTEIETVDIPGHGAIITLRETLNDVESGSARRLWDGSAGVEIDVSDTMGVACICVQVDLL